MFTPQIANYQSEQQVSHLATDFITNHTGYILNKLTFNTEKHRSSNFIKKIIHTKCKQRKRNRKWRGQSAMTPGKPAWVDGRVCRNVSFVQSARRYWHLTL